MSLSTHTESLSLLAKIMLTVPNTTIRVYSGAGIADVHRYDEINDSWRLTPMFGVGVNYNFTPHIMTELGINYTAGYAESELNPSQDYFPFLYSAFFVIGYRW